ncbi:DNA polymerase III subunit alpha [Castellaniella sp.]|uniref:DNA polymerase III subunit alpha n=1 Tax=Castellaniella sp. TaxID=1955812 RepID=UPI002AFF78F5|nr:DNA polymerase III subunit alpha [Castellaniella sp.]
MLKHALSVRSDHSIGESILQIEPMVARAKELGYESVALTDTMSISGLPALTAACKDAEIAPLLGCTLRVYDDATYFPPNAAERKKGAVEKENRTCQIKVYLKSERGLQSLMGLLSRANSAEQFYYHARTDLPQVLALEDVIVTTGDLFGLFHHPDAEAIAQKLSEKHPTYVEVTPIQTMLFDTLNTKALACARSLRLPLLASWPRFYATPEDADTHDVMRAIASSGQWTMDTPWLPIPTTRDMCFDEPKGLLTHLAQTARRIGITKGEIKQSIESMDAVADGAMYRFEKMPISLPHMAADPFVELMKHCRDGWAKRFSAPVLGHQPSGAELQQYKERLAYELGVLRKLGFSNYFLLVQELIGWSKAQDITVGPGRGSAAGSLVSYLLGITDVDPIRFGLLFERFINPDRLDLPDVDMDFMSSRRQEAVAHVVETFGADKVAGISNYSTLGPASSLRDVSRVHGLKPYEYSCSKQMEREHGVSLSLTESADAVPDIAKFRGEHPIIWKHALTLEGNMRNLGTHAAGVIVSHDPIAERAVVMQRVKDSLPIVNWDKRTVEDFGLVKMDMLGLSTLDVLAHAKRYIEERHPGADTDLLTISLEDPMVLDAFGKADTVGVFQFSGHGMRKLLKDLAVLEPLTFEDIAAATALFRPGPIDAGLMDKYVAIKQGKQLPSYVSPLVEPALRETFGVTVYQEQVSRIAVDLCGFTGAEADHLRKAIGKKDHDKMAKMSAKFVAGAVASGMQEYEAQALWSDIEGFAAYCFNKSHSTAYTLISYQTMWLKTNYPAEFYAASLSVEDVDEKLAPLILDARAHGIEVLPPDINVSTDRIEIRDDKTLVAPFQAVKGISTNVAAKILSVRRAHKQPFKSFEEFDEVATATVGGKVNVRHKDSLRKVGAFASVGDGVPALHNDRLKDRLELMPGFTVEVVKAERGLSAGRAQQIQILEIAGQCRICDKCSLSGVPHPTPVMGKNPRFMMVFDSPNWQEGNAGKMMTGDVADAIKAALKDEGISPNDGYYTSLVKGVKPKGQKALTTEQINGCSEYLKREIEVLKPAVIVAMGSNAIRYFSPSIKGGVGDLVGKTIFDPSLDASIIFGFNPASIFFDPGKIKWLQQTCSKVSELLN